MHKAFRAKIIDLIIIFSLVVFVLSQAAYAEDNAKAKILAMYGENKEITGAYDEGLSAKCYNGTFVGKEQNGVVAYKGIPYAAQPVAGLRWKSPVAAPADDKIYEAYYFGHAAIQSEWVSETGSYYPQGEDCLNLNIWVNRNNPSEKKTVMVFFHGGSYAWGGTADPLYDAQNLVEKYDDVIVVTVDFRTGLLGFMDFSEVKGGDEYTTSGNLGLLDQVCALTWIHDNIAAFGGDPSNVTIWGESSGAGGVSLLPLIDGTDGLFRRMIAESGSVALTSPKEDCLALTSILMEESGCSTMKDLVALPIERIIEINESYDDYANFAERDGIVLPEDPYSLYKSGAVADIDMLIGTNADEARYWIREFGYDVPVVPGKLIYDLLLPVMYENNLNLMTPEDRERAETFVKGYPDSRIWSLTEFYNEVLFRLPAVYQAEQNSLNGGRVYMYYWRYPSAVENLGACHAVELAYVFNNPDETIYTGGNINKELADTVQDMWINFARTGDPSTGKYTWHAYDPENRYTMVLDSDIHETSEVNSESRVQLTPLLKYYLHGKYTGLSFNVPYVYKMAGIVIACMAALVLIIVLIIRSIRKKHGVR